MFFVSFNILSLHNNYERSPKMKINVNYISTSHYNRTNIGQWMWMFKRYAFARGFIVRIFGIYINVRENNATEKLIAKAQK